MQVDMPAIITTLASATALAVLIWAKLSHAEKRANQTEERIDKWMVMLTMSNQDLTTRIARLEGRLKGSSQG